jgi:hypothetical protein
VNQPLRPTHFADPAVDAGAPYLYVALRAWWLTIDEVPLGRHVYLAEHLIQRWTPSDSSWDWLVDRQVTGRRVWFSEPVDDADGDGRELPTPWPTGRWRAPYGDFRAAGAGRAPRPRDGSWDDPTEEFLARLPRDPTDLRERLAIDGRADQRGWHQALTLATSCLRTGSPPADLRAALYDAMVTIPGIGLEDGVEDADGRPGLSISWTGRRSRRDAIFDAANGAFLGERTTTSGPDTEFDLPADTITEHTAVSTAAVEHLGAAPAAAARHQPGAPEAPRE